jgi:phage shock protein A
MPAQTHKLLERIAALLKVNLQDLLMESPDPQEAAAHWRAEMESGLADAKDAVAKAVARERQIAKQLGAAESSAAEWDAKVDAALEAGDDARARAALKRKALYERVAQGLQAKLDQHRKVLADMKASVNALQEKVKDLESLGKPSRSGSNAP